MFLLGAAERRIIIRGIQQPSPSSLSSILSVGLGLPRVTLRSNGISDGILFLLVRLCASEYSQRSHSPTTSSPPPFSFFLLLLLLLLLSFFYSLARTHAALRVKGRACSWIVNASENLFPAVKVSSLGYAMSAPMKYFIDKRRLRVKYASNRFPIVLDLPMTQHSQMSNRLSAGDYWYRT